jgi:hypothetical protein
MSEHAFELITLPIGKLFDTIKTCMAAGVNLVVYGPPGIGKTQIAKQAAAALNRIYAEMLLAGRDIGDLMMPYVEPGNGLTFHYNPAIPTVGNNAFDKPTLLNIDEFSGAQRLMQNVLLKVLDEHKVGEAQLRDDVWIMATGNRSFDLAHVEQISAALSNRATFVTVEPDLQTFLHFGVAHNFHPIVLSWCRFDEENLFSFDRDSFLAGDVAFPSPRSNERLSNLLHIRDREGIDDDIFRNLCAGTIGKARGVKFSGFVKIANDMPDLDGLLNGVKQPVPHDPAVIYATLYSLTQKVERPNLQHAVDYIERFEPEWSQMFVSAVTKAKPTIVANKTWGSFIAKVGQEEE